MRTASIVGKVQTAGIATALKVLFELDETEFSFAEDLSVDGIIQRSELAALLNGCPPTVVCYLGLLLA